MNDTKLLSLLKSALRAKKALWADMQTMVFTGCPDAFSKEAVIKAWSKYVEETAEPQDYQIFNSDMTRLKSNGYLEGTAATNVYRYDLFADDTDETGFDTNMVELSLEIVDNKDNPNRIIIARLP